MIRRGSPQRRVRRFARFTRRRRSRPIRPMSSVAALGVAREVTAARALGLFGALALLLAAVGLHGVMARLVNDRRRELGIRIALGAEPRAVRWLVVGRTLRIALLGIVSGITASVLISRQLGALLHGVSAADPWSSPAHRRCF